MKVHGQHTVGSRLLQHVRTYAAAYGHPWFVLFVALSIAEIRHYYRHAVGTCALQSIYVEHKLHKLVVGVESYGLHKVNILVPDAFIYAHECVAFGEDKRGIVANGAAKIVAHLLHEFGAGAAAEYPYLITASKTKHRALSPLYGFQQLL